MSITAPPTVPPSGLPPGPLWPLSVEQYHQMIDARILTEADAALFVEVSDTTLTQDRGPKKRIYARANIPQYWIINLVDRQIEMYREPDAAAGEYRQPTMYGPQDEVPVVIDGKMIGTLRL